MIDSFKALTFRLVTFEGYAVDPFVLIDNLQSGVARPELTLNVLQSELRGTAGGGSPYQSAAIR